MFINIKNNTIPLSSINRIDWSRKVVYIYTNFQETPLKTSISEDVYNLCKATNKSVFSLKHWGINNLPITLNDVISMFKDRLPFELDLYSRDVNPEVYSNGLKLKLTASQVKKYSNYISRAEMGSKQLQKKNGVFEIESDEMVTAYIKLF